MEPLPRPLILNLGAGDRPMKGDGVANHDRLAFTDSIRLTWDLEADCWPDVWLYHYPTDQKHWAFHTGSPIGEDVVHKATGDFDEVHARDVLEHVAPSFFYEAMDHCWDQLRVGGRMHIQVPQHGSLNAVIDPTHWRGFHIDSFDYLDPRTRLGRASWTTDKRWHIVVKEQVPRSNVNLRFILEKIDAQSDSGDDT